MKAVKWNHKNVITKQWKLYHQIVRQLDIDEYLCEDKNKYLQRGFLVLYDASYSHMDTGIDCEPTGKKIKARIKNRNRLSMKELKKETSIEADEPSLFEIDGFIDQFVNMWLDK